MRRRWWRWRYRDTESQISVANVPGFEDYTDEK